MSDYIFGYTWEQIQRAQQKDPTALRERPTYAPKPMATKDDVALLEKHGLAGLEEMEFYGVIDRLRNSGII